MPRRRAVGARGLPGFQGNWDDEWAQHRGVERDPAEPIYVAAFRRIVTQLA
jgi:hypothetical protein